MSAFKIVIPARYGSSRLPGKPLLLLAGQPMIAHVCQRALQAGAEEVVVATDDERIVDALAPLPVTAMLTSPEHNSGTERIAEVADRLNWSDSTFVVNLQGDEPLMEPALIGRLARALSSQRIAEVATLAAQVQELTDVFNPNAVKVVLDARGYALYFSRAPIPWHRESFGTGEEQLPEYYPYLRHIGIYAYSAGFLRRYVEWPASALENVESLEQLRILWMGERILVVPVDEIPEAGIDTEEDLHRVRERLAHIA